MFSKKVALLALSFNLSKISYYPNLFFIRGVADLGFTKVRQ